MSKHQQEHEPGTNCPKCEDELDDENVLGLEIWGKYDGVSFWRHVDCGALWCRFCGAQKGHRKGCRIGGSISEI